MQTLCLDPYNHNPYIGMLGSLPRAGVLIHLYDNEQTRISDNALTGPINYFSQCNRAGVISPEIPPCTNTIQCRKQHITVGARGMIQPHQTRLSNIHKQIFGIQQFFSLLWRRTIHHIDRNSGQSYAPELDFIHKITHILSISSLVRSVSSNDNLPTMSCVTPCSINLDNIPISISSTNTKPMRRLDPPIPAGRSSSNGLGTNFLFILPYLLPKYIKPTHQPTNPLTTKRNPYTTRNDLSKRID